MPVPIFACDASPNELFSRWSCLGIKLSNLARKNFDTSASLQAIFHGDYLELAVRVISSIYKTLYQILFSPQLFALYFYFVALLSSSMQKRERALAHSFLLLYLGVFV